MYPLVLHGVKRVIPPYLRSVSPLNTNISAGNNTSGNVHSESSFEDSNKNIHSGNEYVLFLVCQLLLLMLSFSRIDVSDEFSFEHMLEFSKLATAFAIELGQWEA